MQTFLISADPLDTARALDYRRLGKQRVEAIQILNTLVGFSDAWKNHPAVKMWKGFEPFLLCDYLSTMITEWGRRGYRNDKIFESYRKIHQELRTTTKSIQITPDWFCEELFLTHKSNLIRKYPEYYRPIFGNDIPDDLPYFWPV